MSMSTTSGRCRRARSTAWSPSSASPTSSRSAACSIIARNPVRISGWSSAMPTRTVTPAPRTAAGPTPGSRRRDGGRPQVAAEHRHPLAHADDAVPAPDGSAIGARRALVLDLDRDASSGVAHVTVALAPPACLITLVSASCTMR